MQTIEIQTLIDITNTKVIRANQGSRLEFDQYRNYTTIKQCVELRGNVIEIIGPTVEEVEIKDFGSRYTGKHRLWTIKFIPERANVYADDHTEVGLLIEDLDKVPIIKNLSETINIDKAIFNLKDSEFKNTLIKAH